MKKFIVIMMLVLCMVSTGLSQVKYWSTAHYANWDLDNNLVSYAKLPWQYLTHFILFAGGTGGNQTYGTSPYFQCPADFKGAAADSLIKYAHRFGVKIEMDLGQNNNNQYDNLFKAGDVALQLWASTVAHIIASKGYDGGDFDWEGGGYPPTTTGHQHKMSFDMVKYIRDTLSVLVPGKTFCFTVDLMASASDVGGWDLPALTQNNLIDQVNIMWYDQCYPMPSPLYKSSAHSCWSSDSAQAFQFAAAGIPKNKIGIGYAIQVYTGCNSCYAYFYQQISHLAGATVNWDDQAKARWLTNGTYSLAYEDTLTGYWKAAFIKEYGFGGAMGFSIGYGFLPTPPVGWDYNPAVKGVGGNLIGNIVTPPQVLSVSLLQTPNAVVDSVGKLMTFTVTVSPNPDSVVFYQNGSRISILAGPAYSFPWIPSSPGNVQNYAVAFKAGYSTAQSNIVTITVPTPPSPPVTSSCNYDSVAALNYAKGQISINKDSIYQAGISFEKSQIPDSLNVTLTGKVKVPK